MTEYIAPTLNRRRSYKKLLEAVITANGEWVRVSLDEISGSNNTTKRSVVLQVGYQRGLDFQTSIVDGFIYVRMRNGGNVHGQSRNGQALAPAPLETSLGT